METSQGRGTRARVLDAALALFSTKGFDGTAVTDIEREAGLSPGSGSFYRHFPSKDAVLRALLDREMDRALLDQQQRVEIADGTDPGSTLALDFQRVLDGFENLTSLIELLVRERTRLSDAAAAIRSVMVEGGVGADAELIERLVPAEPGDPTAQEVATVAFTSLAGVHLTRQFFSALPYDMSPERYAEVLAFLVLGRRRA